MNTCWNIFLSIVHVQVCVVLCVSQVVVVAAAPLYHGLSKSATKTQAKLLHSVGDNKSSLLYRLNAFCITIFFNVQHEFFKNVYSTCKRNVF